MSTDDPEAHAFAADRIAESFRSGESVSLPPAVEPISFADSTVAELVR